MTETPEQTDPEQQRAATADPAAAGARLREVRESKSMSPAEVAAQLHLNEQTIRALEQNDPDRLPAPIYVRGYVRAYARLLGLNEEELLALYAPAQSPELRTVGMPPPAQNALGRPRLPWRFLGTLLLLAAVGWLAVYVLPGLWERFRSGDETAPVVETPSLLEPLPEAVVPEPADGGAGAIRLPERTLSSPELAPPPAAPVAPEPTPEPEPVPAPAPPPQVESAPAEPAVPPVSAQPEAERRSLSLRLNQESWISIRDADGERLLVGLYPAGSRHRLSGRPPLQVVLGNAAGVELTVDGEPYSLSGYAPGSVARFTLE
jgi:cytoskeleton protein RodZ